MPVSPDERDPGPSLTPPAHAADERLGRRTRLATLGVLAGAFVLLAALLVPLVADRFREVEDFRIAEALDRARDTIGEYLKAIDSKAGDWSQWDDSYEFVARPTQHFIDTNVPDNSLVQLEINLVAFVDPSHRVVLAKAVDLESATAAPVPAAFRTAVPADSPLLRAGMPGHGVSGTMLVDGRCLLVAARPLLNSLGEGPSRGTLIFGRFVDRALTARLSAVAHLDLEVWAYGDPALPAPARAARAALGSPQAMHLELLDDDRAAAYAYLAGLDGRPAMLVRIETDRRVHRVAAATLWTFVAAFAAAGIVAGVLVWVLFLRLERSRRALRRSEAQRVHEATHDPTTGLPNRFLLVDRIRMALAEARRRHDSVAVVSLSLDGFQEVNDGLGHAAGDLVLRGVAQRLVARVREGDTVARSGGAAFALALTHLHGAEDAARVAERLLECVRPPVPVDGREATVTASIGIAVFPEDGDDPDRLARDAGLAMHEAHAQGGDCFRMHDASLAERIRTTVELRARLREALERRQFVLHYQPQIELGTGSTVAVEALVRWRDPERGLVPPAVFIPVAEETGLIVPLGEWVLRQACAQAEEWRTSGPRACRVAVNVSARQFRPDLPALVTGVLRDTGLPAAFLELEITESLAMRDAGLTRTILDELRTLGVSLSLDDFGTGFSSLAHLSGFPVQSLKIDRSFLLHDFATPRNQALVGAMIGIAHNLGMQVVAEGVETVEHEDFLRRHRCDLLQGYRYSKPVPAEEVTSRLSAEPALPPAGGGPSGPAPGR